MAVCHTQMEEKQTGMGIMALSSPATMQSLFISSGRRRLTLLDIVAGRS
jgi:hypothetical protein